MIKAKEDLTAEGGCACRIMKMGTVKHQHPFFPHFTNNFTGVINDTFWMACEEPRI